MRVIGFITQPSLIRRILDHLRKRGKPLALPHPCTAQWPASRERPLRTRLRDRARGEVSAGGREKGLAPPSRRIAHPLSPLPGTSQDRPWRLLGPRQGVPGRAPELKFLL